MTETKRTLIGNLHSHWNGLSKKARTKICEILKKAGWVEGADSWGRIYDKMDAQQRKRVIQILRKDNAWEPNLTKLKV
jgi:hypothetical protein